MVTALSTTGPLEVTGHYGPKGFDQSSQSNISYGQSVSNQQAASQQAAQGSSFSQSYIPEYSQTPILESIAKQAQNMAPEVYQWGINQYNKNQGNIDTMMKSALAYASPERTSLEMGKAEAGVQQGAEAGRQSAIKDLQSYGIDPSSGRYAALDQASRVSSAAAAAGAGNLQRDTVQKTAGELQGQAMQLSNQNLQTGYGAAGAANALLGTASQLKYSPLGTMSGSTQSSAGASASSGGTTSTNQSIGGGSSSKVEKWAEGGSIPDNNVPTDDDATMGGFVSNELSPSAGAKVDDVDARLNAGEFVIPKDVAAWKGQEFFYKLMAQARKMRAMAGQESGQGMGYADGGEETVPAMAAGGPMTGGMQGMPAYGGGGGAPQGAMTGGVQGMPAPQAQFAEAPGLPYPSMMPQGQQNRFAPPQIGYGAA